MMIQKIRKKEILTIYDDDEKIMNMMTAFMILNNSEVTDWLLMMVILDRLWGTRRTDPDTSHSVA